MTAETHIPKFVRFDAMIIDPDPTSRGYLWQATLAEVSFHKVKAFSKTDTAIAHLAQGAKFDVVLITSGFIRDDIINFIHEAKQTDGGKEAAYIWVLKTVHQTTDNIAFGLIDGTDGFLLEPFSVDSLQQVAAIAARVRKEYDRQRKKVALTLVVKEIMSALDEFALSKVTKKSVAAAAHEFKKATEVLRKLEVDDIEIYHELACEMFEKGVPRPPVAYRGASTRVKQKMKEVAAERMMHHPTDAEPGTEGAVEPTADHHAEPEPEATGHDEKAD